MSCMVKRIWSIVTWAVTALVVLLAVLLAGVRLVGLRPYTVLSGSMEPQYHVGSIIYIRQVDPTTLSVNDPITYRLDSGTVVTHRIVEVQNDGGELIFRTRGDANAVADGGRIPARNILGKPLFSIPYLGYVSEFIQRPPGSFLVIGGIALLTLLFFLKDLLFPAKETETQERPEESSAFGS